MNISIWDSALDAVVFIVAVQIDISLSPIRK